MDGTGGEGVLFIPGIGSSRRRARRGVRGVRCYFKRRESRDWCGLRHTLPLNSAMADGAFTRGEQIISDKELLENWCWFFKMFTTLSGSFFPDDVKPGFISLLGLWKIVILPHLIRRKFHLVCSLWCLLMACGNFISWFRRLPALVNVGNVAPGNLRGYTARMGDRLVL